MARRGSTAVLLISFLAGVVGARGQTLAAAQRRKMDAPQILQLANSYFSQGDYESARQYYLQALPHFPETFNLLNNLAYCYFVQGPRGRERAAHYYQVAIRMNPGDHDAAEKLAQCLLDLNRPGEAAEIFLRIAESHTASPEAWKNAAAAYGAAHRNPEAVGAYRAYLKSRPDDFGARTDLATLLSREKEYAAALEQLKIVLSARPDFSAARVAQARILSWQGRYAESLAIFDRVLRDEPDNGDAASGKAYVLLWSGHPREAEAIFGRLHRRFPQDSELSAGLTAAQSAIKDSLAVPAPAGRAAVHDESYFLERLSQDPRDLPALRALANMLATPQRCPESIRYGRRALAVSPEDPTLEFGLAHSLSLCQQYSEAIDRYRRFLSARPQAEDGLYELAQAYLRAHRTEESIATLRSLIQLNPANGDARLRLAEALAADGKYGEASAQYDNLLKTSPDNYDALQGKAFVLYWSKQLAQGRVIFQELAARNPGDPQNTQALEEIARAEVAERWAALRPSPGAPPADFAKYFEKRLASYPNDVDAMKGLAQAEEEAKNLPAALRAYRQLAAKYPNDLDARMELARLLGRDRQYDSAVKIYSEIVKSDPANADALDGLAAVDIESGHAREALPIYRELATKYPSNLGYKLEGARLEMTLKNYPAARDILAAVLVADPRNHEARTRLAQVELNQGAWDAAQKHFSELLLENADDPDALMGKAQVSYYKGNLAQAQSSAVALVSQQPRNFDAVFLLANIEHARHNRRATLSLLDQAVAISPGNTEAKEMKEKVWAESRATLHTSAVYAREIGPPAPCTNPAGCGQLDLHEDLRDYSYGSTLDLAFLPRTESYVSFTSLPSESPPGRNALGNPLPLAMSGTVAPQEFLYRQSTDLSPHFTLRAGAGYVRFGPRAVESLPVLNQFVRAAGTSPLVQGGFTISPDKIVSFDFNASRSDISYTPLAARLGVMETRLEAGLNIAFSPRTDLHLDYFYARETTEKYLHQVLRAGLDLQEFIEDRDQGQNVSVMFNHRFIQLPRFSFDAGFASQEFGFAGHARQVFMGFFNPGFYQSQLVVTHFQGRVSGPMGYDFQGKVGLQQTEHGRALTRASEVSPAFTFQISRAFLLTLGYTHYNTAQALGAVSGNAVRVSTDWKF